MEYLRGCFESSHQIEPEDIRKVKKFLDRNQDFLNDYIARKVPAITLKNLLRLKRNLNGTGPETASNDYDCRSGSSTPNTFPFSKDCGSKDVCDQPIPKTDTIVSYDDAQVYGNPVHRGQQPTGTRMPLRLSRSAPEVMMEMAEENSSQSPLNPSEDKDLCCLMNWVIRGEHPWLPPGPTHIIVKQPGTSSANGHTKRLLPDDDNILYQMSGEEYKDVLDSIQQCILATDHAAFFPNLKKINELVFGTPQFDWDDTSHRDLGRSIRAAMSSTSKLLCSRTRCTGDLSSPTSTSTRTWSG